ncbi:MAG: hypothetical protein JSV17_16345 [Candidatus Aminicenantes bacterium]|nr:MAG: hypothetical protein JSV17_16345 [Candidatus Aminicenantes bacterium]
MKRVQIVTLIIMFPLIAFGLALFCTIYKNASSFTIAAHSFRPPLLLFSMFFSGFLALLIISWRFMTKGEENMWENFFAFLPLGFSLLTPILLCFYLTSEDLKVRLNLLLGSMILGFVLIKLVQWYQRGRLKDLWERSISRFTRLTITKKLLILFLAAFLIYHLCALCHVSKGMSYSGDEPYYLMTTHSLYQDGDINLAQNYRDRDYSHFYPKELYPKVRLLAYARAGRKGRDYLWPINQPGVSVLMLPYYWLSQKFHGLTLIYLLKISLSVWAVLLGLQIFLFAQEFWKNEKVSLLLWFFYSLSAPLLFYAFHLYPEVPIALFSVYVFRKVRSKKRNSLSFFHYCFFGFLIALFPWFGLKYNMIMWPLLFVSVYFLVKNHKAKGKILAFLAFPVISVALFAFYTKELYGTFYPMAIYEGVLTPEKIQAFREVVMKIPVMIRIDSFLDYFLDQRDGLLLYSPMYFFIFLGGVEAFRRSKKDLFALLFISLPYLLNYAFLSHRQGHSPQGRVLTSISWIAAIFIGYFLVHNRKKLYSFLFWILSLTGLVFVIILLRNPHFLYQPTTHEFTFRGGELFLYLSNLHFYFPDLLPSFIKVNNLRYLPNYIWLAAILVFIAGYLWKKDDPQKKMKKTPWPFLTPFLTICGMAVFFLWFVLFPRAILMFPTKAAYSSGERISFYDLGRHVQMKKDEPGRFTITKDHHALDLHFTSWREIENLKIEFGSLEGKYQVNLKFFDQKLYSGIVSREMKTLVQSSPSSYRYKNTNLYRLSIEIKNLSDISTARNPFLLNFQPIR